MNFPMKPLWIERAEKRLGFIAIPDLALFLAAMNALVGFLSLLKPQFPDALVLDPQALVQGQYWRALTFLFVPPPMTPLWLIFWLIFLFWIMKRLEGIWGDFGFLAYVLIGALAVVSCSVFLGRPLSNSVFVTSLILALARLDSNLEIYPFFIPLITIRMYWVWIFCWALIGWIFIFGSFSDRLYYGLGVLNYLVFFGPEHWNNLRLAWRKSRSGLS